MKSTRPNPAKELYQRLRTRSGEELWSVEVPRFDSATPEERLRMVGLVRAVGVVFSETGTASQREEARAWLRGLLRDPQEKIRRYAMAALPKIGSGAREEAELLTLLRTASAGRERGHLARVLAKIGGAATLEAVSGTGLAPAHTEQKAKAAVARARSPGGIRMDRALAAACGGPRLHLRGHTGLETFVKQELEENPRTRRKLRVLEVRPGLVIAQPVAPFTVGDLYTLRCMGTVAFVAGMAAAGEGGGTGRLDALARVITAPLSRQVLETFSTGAIRYRLDFVGRGHQRGAVRELAQRVYALCPALLNDASRAPWAIELHPEEGGEAVELRPRLIPDPRFAYRVRDVPAASHPPLAACMARLAVAREGLAIWDPFCGSGLELIECALRLGGAAALHGSDRDAEAIQITRENYAAALPRSRPPDLFCGDFRDYARLLGPGNLDVIITNPPMGRRVPVGDLSRLIADLFAAATRLLRPGGRLVFANPLRVQPSPGTLRLQLSQVVDFGGFNCRLEVHQQPAVAGSTPGRPAARNTRRPAPPEGNRQPPYRSRGSRRTA